MPIVTIVVVLVLAVVVAVIVFRSGPGAPPEPGEAAEQSWPLTGMAVDELPARPALVVKVSNSREARPQTGLDAADVVFEELTEGGITRFAAVFHSQLPEVVGPVRSARPVDVQLVSGFGHPGFAHSGARPEVRVLLADAPAATITEGGPGFFRDDGTYASHPVAPHDLFLRVAPALEAVVGRGAEPLGDLGWVFGGPPASGTVAGDGSAIEVRMSPSSTTSWTFDADAERYERRQDGEPTQLTGGGRVAAANVVVLDVRHHVGDSGYPETDVVGAGPGLALRDGRAYAVTWSKPSAAAPLVLHAGDGGVDFPLAPGPTWIHLADEVPDLTP